MRHHNFFEEVAAGFFYYQKIDTVFISTKNISNYPLYQRKSSRCPIILDDNFCRRTWALSRRQKLF